MPDRRRRNCGCCGKHQDEVGPISWGGLCNRCGKLLCEENMVGISTRTGPAHLRRLRGYAKYLQREMLDATTTTP